MKREPNNEMDLLLRQLSRRNGAFVSEIGEQHLDADELNSYVANALPAAARARYVEHLADCSVCRKLVAQLVAAQGPVPAPQTASAVAPSGLKAFLASLFSPMVLRYAAPALGLIVIAVVAVVELRMDRRAVSPIAQLNERDEAGSVAAVSPRPESPASQPAYRDGQTVTQAEDKSVTKTQAPQRQPVAPVAKDGPVAANQPADAAGAAAAPPAAPSKAATAESEAAPEGDLEKQKKQEVAQQQAAARDEAKARAEANKNQAAATGTASVTVTAGQTARKDVEVRSAKSRESTPESPGRDFKRMPEETAGLAFTGEVRSVGGRSFRKRGNVWVDTGFDSSKPVTNVARGSEQYRALVADEPSIRTIAEQLAGEIIVVWKGRTYRIR